MTTRERQVLGQARKLGLLRPRDLDPLGIPRETLSRMVAKGILVRVGRGLYTLPDFPLTEHHSFAEVAKQVPQGVICLLSALRYHGLTTQALCEVWLGIPSKARKPSAESIRLRVVRFSQPGLNEGVDTKQIRSPGTTSVTIHA